MNSFLLAAMLTPVAMASTQVTWASAAFTYHGEKLPFLTDGPYNLTPLGAQQLLLAGSLLRSRYISPPVNGSQLTIGVPINGLNVDDIDNAQMQLLSTNDEYVTASAMAFMQGLYPPKNADGQGALTVDVESIMGNGSLIQFPLGGYQYPNIESLGSLDFNSIWIAGHEGCNNYSVNMIRTLNSADYVNKMVKYEDFYQGLADKVFWQFDKSILNFANAWELYEYAAFQYEHNKLIYNSLLESDMAKLRTLASEQQWIFNTAVGGNSVNAIAGKTLASKIFAQLSSNIKSKGAAEKLSLMFGSFEPMFSFFALSSLSSGPSSSRFVSLPQPGSSIIFELFSYSSDTNAAQNLTTPYPSTEDLWVRFLFRNGTDDNSPLIAYPLFGRGNSEVDMSWKDFADGIGEFAIDDVADWCSACSAVNLFCEAIESNLSNQTSSGSISAGGNNKISPIVAGVIGAIVTLALLIIAALALIFFGFRIAHREKKNPAAKNSDLGVLKRSGSGGFKGAEKLASDTDLTLKGGAGATIIRHERVGSWELNNSPKSPTHSSLDKEIGLSKPVSTVDYSRRSEDGIGNVNPFGDPVKPVDHI